MRVNPPSSSPLVRPGSTVFGIKTGADVVQIQKSGDLFRLLYNTKGRFVLHRISEEESKFKLCRVNKVRRWGLVDLVLSECFWWRLVCSRFCFVTRDRELRRL